MKPYVKIELSEGAANKEKKKNDKVSKAANVKKGELKPDWGGEVVSCSIPKTQNYIEVEVWDDDMTSDDLVGEARIMLADIRSGKMKKGAFELFYELKKKKTSGGKINLEFVWIPATATTADGKPVGDKGRHGDGVGTDKDKNGKPTQPQKPGAKTDTTGKAGTDADKKAKETEKGAKSQSAEESKTKIPDKTTDSKTKDNNKPVDPKTKPKDDKKPEVKVPAKEEKKTDVKVPAKDEKKADVKVPPKDEKKADVKVPAKEEKKADVKVPAKEEKKTDAKDAKAKPTADEELL